MRYQGKFKTIKEEVIRVEIDSDNIPLTDNLEYKYFKVPDNNTIYYDTYSSSTYDYPTITLYNQYAAWIREDHVSSSTQLTGGSLNFTMPDGSVVVYKQLSLLRHTQEKGRGTLIYGGQVDAITNMFKDCAFITSIYLPSTCTIVSGGTFSGCTRLTDLYSHNITYFGESCFSGCIKLKYVNLSKATFIDYRSFYNCTDLTYDDLKLYCSIGEEAFSNCKSIERITFFGSYEIGYNAFSGCTYIQSVRFNNVSHIKQLAFSGCTSLSKIEIYDGLPGLDIHPTSYIGKTAFDNISPIGILYLDMEDDYTSWSSVLPSWDIENNNIELTFAGESPIIIEQTSDDGIFSPIKSRGATIITLTKIPYFEIYSGKAQGTRVEIQNTSKGEILFKGFLTPCQYSQPFVNLDELELECVDALSSLKDIDYHYLYGTPSCVSVYEVIKFLICDIAGYTGHIYAPTALPTHFSRAFENEYIDDENFYDDDDEHTPWKCYDVLAEICRIYGVSCVPLGDDIYFLDNRITARYGMQYPSYTQPTNGTLTYYDYTDKKIVNLGVEKTIGILDYLGESHSVELDEVYNKISVSCNIYEIEKDDLITDIIEDAEKSYIWAGNSTYWYHIKDSDDYNIDTKSYVLEDSRWKSRYFALTDTTYTNDSFIENNANPGITYLKEIKSYYDGHWMPYNNQEDINAVCPIISRSFSYDQTTTMPFKANWNDYLSIYLQPLKMHMKHPRTNLTYNQIISNHGSVQNYWYSRSGTGYYANFYAPVLEYEFPEPIKLESPNSTNLSYLVFKGDILWQNHHTHYAWKRDGGYGEKDGSMFYLNYPLSELNIGEVNVAKRGRKDSQFNKGWGMLDLQLQIGDKYWNGTDWQYTPCRFTVNYHKKNVVNEDETLTLFGWNKPVTNHTYKDMINEEGWAIPLFNTIYKQKPDGTWGYDYWTDANLYGKLKLTIFTPLTPWDNQLTSNGSNSTMSLNYKRTCPIIYMQNLGLKLVHVDKTESWKYVGDLEEEKDDDDDVIYSNIIDMSNVTELDDIEMKINTYYSGKPYARSYLCSKDFSGSYYYIKDGFTDVYTGSKIIPEQLVIDRYYEHYSTPKKIYNAEVRGYYKPYLCVQVSALPGSRFIVDSQLYDVKSDKNEIKLIEY